MQDQPLGGDAREDQDVRMEFYETLDNDDQAQMGEDMGQLENEMGVDPTFGQTINRAWTSESDPMMPNLGENHDNTR